MNFKDYRKESRNNWGANQEKNLSLEQIQAGCLLRIADATEVMAKEYNSLLYSAKHQKSRADRLQSELDTERRRSAALRGHIKRLKAKGKGDDHE